MIVHIGIDPGYQGAVAAILQHNPDAQPQAVVVDTPVVKVKKGRTTRSMYNETEMRRLLVDLVRNATTVVIALENTNGRPGQAVNAVWAQAMGIGLWRGILVGLALPYQEVWPQVWKKEILRGVGDGKAASYIPAARLFPGVAKELQGARGGVLDGRCDAICIAEYARRVFTPRQQNLFGQLASVPLEVEAS